MSLCQLFLAEQATTIQRIIFVVSIIPSLVLLRNTTLHWCIIEVQKNIYTVVITLAEVCKLTVVQYITHLQCFCNLSSVFLSHYAH